MALRRQVKNVVRNFSDIEVKVREATSNDPWGPSSSLTSEIADATYNNQAFTETMALLWKRMNDHGKNWRHVYKSLVVLDYIVKTGSERVAAQCRENIFAIKTLKDFQFIDKDGKDQGQNVREKSKQLVALLKDEERLKSERQRALKAKERFMQSQGGIGNTSFPKNKKFQGESKYPADQARSVDDLNVPSNNYQEYSDKSDTHSTDGRINSDLEKVRPSNEVEEEMQLQIALAMSREEAEKEPSLPQAPEASGAEGTLISTDAGPNLQNGNNFDPWGEPKQNLDHKPINNTTSDPWGASPTQPINTNSSLNQPTMNSNMSINSNLPISDPWNSTPNPPDPWGQPKQEINADPWSHSSTPAINISNPMNNDPFAPQNSLSSVSQNSPMAPFPLSTLPPSQMQISNDFFSPSPSYGGPSPLSSQQSSPKSAFLANGAHLVDMDNIVNTSNKNTGISNPFSGSTNTNPFMQDKPKPKSINEIRNEQTGSVFAQQSGDILLPSPLQPNDNSTQNNNYNPFL